MKTGNLRLAILKRWWRLTVPPRLRAEGVEIGRGAIFNGMPIVSMAEFSSIKIGAGVVLTSHSDFTPIGVSRPCILRTLQNAAFIEIGENTGMSGTVICAAVSVTIGKECLIGADVVIMDTDFHALKPDNRRYNNRHEDIGSSPVIIGANVFLGARSMVMSGVTIGDNSVIGAGSIVTKDIPSNVIAAGTPAAVLRKISC